MRESLRSRPGLEQPAVCPRFCPFQMSRDLRDRKKMAAFAYASARGRTAASNYKLLEVGLGVLDMRACLQGMRGVWAFCEMGGCNRCAVPSTSLNSPLPLSLACRCWRAAARRWCSGGWRRGGRIR